MKLFDFDTRDKKPKLYSLIVATAIAALAVGVIILIDPARSAAPVCVAVAIYCLSAILILLYSFREQIRYNPYSYNTIFYFGFALFALSVMITHIVLAVRLFSAPVAYSATQILHSLLGSAKNYILLSSPFLLVFSVALCVSNVSLLKHEGVRPVNFLAIVLSFFIVAGAVFIYVFDFSASGSQNEVMVHDLITNIIAAIYLYVECMIIGTIVADVIAALHEPKKDKDFIIILGCGLRKDGTPTPLLRGRVDRAIVFYKKQKEETGKEALFITSGGKGSDEMNSESTAMKRYMLSQGIPEDRIIEEDQSTTTFENMKFSKEKILALDPNAKIAFSTSNFHVFRSGLFARRVKMRAVGMGAKAKWYYWPNAAVREFADLLIHHKLKQTIILGAMIAAYAALTVLAYNL